MLTRRQLLKTGVVSGAALALPWKFLVRNAYAMDQSPGIPLFGTTLRGIGTIPVAAPDSDGSARDRCHALHDRHQPVHGPDRAALDGFGTDDPVGLPADQDP